jgi:hypothetical protein
MLASSRNHYHVVRAIAICREAGTLRRMPTRSQPPARLHGENPQVRGANKVLPADRAAGQPWLVLLYRIQSEPTRLRAAVWRRLKTLGAIYLQSGTAALPYDAASERALRRLQLEILQMSGSSILFRCEVLSGETEAIDAFNTARSDEYDEIINKCQGFLRQIEQEHVAEHFTFAELEENEVDLVKLQKWLSKIRVRDVFGAPGRQEADQLLAECEAALERYADRVYALDADAN